MKKKCLSIIVIVTLLTCSCGNQEMILEGQDFKDYEETVSLQSEEINQEDKATEYIFANWEQEIEKFEMSDSMGIIRNIRDLVWLAQRNGLNIELVSESMSEEDNEYILESNTVISDEDRKKTNDTDIIWLRIVQDTVKQEEGTSISEYKDILAYIQDEDAYIATQSTEYTNTWTLWKIPMYGDWLYKEIAIFMRIKTGL